jgi:hypothetical protein
MRSRFVWLFLWLAGILFPMAWLGRFSPGYRRLFQAVFAPAWVHLVMHAALYAGLVVLVIVAFNLALTRRTTVRLLLTVLSVGLLQEGLQLIAGVQVLGWNTLLDLGVDLSGALLGYTGIFVMQKIQRIKET